MEVKSQNAKKKKNPADELGKITLFCCHNNI